MLSSLNIQPTVRPVTQWLHRFGKEKRKQISEEVARLLAVRFIRAINHPVWVANPMFVKKKNEI